MNQFQLTPVTFRLITAGLIALGMAGLLSGCSGEKEEAPAEPGAATSATGGAATAAKPALTVNTVQARASVLPIKLSANGSVVAWQEAIIGAEANGLRVLELQANVGDAVQRGQVLARFASESVQADVALARAGVLEASANVLEATANAERARSLQNTGALSAQQISQYLTGEQTAKARVESAKAALDMQLLRLKNTQVLAPDSGVISARTASVGSVVGAGSEMFRLIRQNRLEWRGEVTAAELERIAVGTKVVVTSPGGSRLTGQVRMLAPTVDAQTRNGLVFVTLQGPPAGAQAVAGAFKPGMYARGEFELGQSGAVTLPQTALVVRDGFSYIYRVGKDNRVAQVKVQSGRMVGEQIEIQTALKTDDRFVASGGSFLSDGDLVRVVDNPKPNTAAAPVKPAQAATK